MANARAKTRSEVFSSRSKNHFYVRRREDAIFMGLYNPVILRQWRASMDLQVVRDGFAATKYILGYVMKSDTDSAAQNRFESFVNTQMAHATGSRQDIYRAAH
eukprot:11605977-Alexandrium_andersonii.AAC.1